MQRKLDDIVSITIVLGITALFVGVSFARWPNPYRLQTFQIEHVNPLGSLYSHRHGHIRIANN
jgi:hypothetical protein